MGRVRELETLSPQWDILNLLPQSTGNFAQEKAERLQDPMGLESTIKTAPLLATVMWYSSLDAVNTIGE